MSRAQHRCPKTRYALLLLSLLISYACDGPVDAPDVIVGEVTLLDERGTRFTSSEGVRVTLLGPDQDSLAATTTSGSGEFSLTVTGSDGPYALSFEKAGFGTTYRFGIDSDSDPIVVAVFERSSAEPAAVSADAYRCGEDRCVDLTLSIGRFFGDETTRRVFRLFVGGQDVSSSAYEVTDLLFVPNDHPGLTRVGDGAQFTVGKIRGLIDPFASESSVRIVVHGATENLTNGFVDPTSGAQLFTDLSPNAASAVVIVP